MFILLLFSKIINIINEKFRIFQKYVGTEKAM